ncbi:MAG: sensor histidine kinase [Myxococcota bacterium]
MSRFRTSLPLRLIAFVLVPLAVFLGLAGVLVLRALEQEFERRMQEDVEMVARALQRPVSHGLERGHDRGIRMALQSALDIGRVYGAYLYDDERRLLASIGRVDTDGPPRRMHNLQRDDPQGRGEYDEVAGEAVYSYYVPVRLGGDHGTGVLQITRRKEDFRRLMDRLRLQTLVLLFAGLLVMGIIVIAGYHGAAGRALGRFAGSIRRVQEGEPQHRAARAGPREVVGLVDAFNSMLDSIQEAEKRIARERERRNALKLRLVASEKLAAIGRLAGSIAHELGSPLGAVAGRLQRVRRVAELPNRARAEIDAIAADVERMDSLVREVLSFARADHSRRRPLGAGVVARMAVARMESEAEASGARLRVRGEEPGPLVLVDPARVEMALVNLLRNALQSAPGGQVELTWWGDGDAACWAVTDDGPGIPDDVLPRIFEPFFTTKGHEEGTGLGLAIVAAVATEHGGTATAEAVEPQGIRMVLRIPQTEDTSGELEVAHG